jgi:hypothetical protein
MMNLNAQTFLTEQEIKSKAPSIFTKTSSPDVSDKYTHIPTSIVIEDMSKLGWGVVDVKEVKARKGVGFQKHLIVFRNNDIVINGEDGDVVYPQLLLTNSHDGKSSFTFTAGLFRMICENGLVISTQTFESVKMRHLGYTFEELQQNIITMVENLPLTVESMNKMKSTQITPKDKLELAKRAVISRFDNMEIENVDDLNIDFESLLSPTREEDKGNDLWTVFNILQEKVLNGDFQYISGTKIRKARKIKNFQQDIKVNQRIFEAALELA